MYTKFKIDVSDSVHSNLFETIDMATSEDSPEPSTVVHVFEMKSSATALAVESRIKTQVYVNGEHAFIAAEEFDKNIGHSYEDMKAYAKFFEKIAAKLKKNRKYNNKQRAAVASIGLADKSPKFTKSKVLKTDFLNNTQKGI